MTARLAQGGDGIPEKQKIEAGVMERMCPRARYMHGVGLLTASRYGRRRREWKAMAMAGGARAHGVAKHAHGPVALVCEQVVDSLT